MRAADRYFQPDDTRLRYRDEGEGEAVVFLHGWTLDLEIWDPQAAEFRRALRVIRFDRRGHGLSGGSPAPGQDVRDLEALLDHLRVPRAALVGMSQGARTALAFALHSPQRVAALALDGPPDFRGTGEHDPELPMERFRALASTAGVDAFRAAWRDHPLMRLHSGDRSATELVARSLARYAARDLLEPAQAPPAQVDEQSLGRLQLPVLVITGERDLAGRLRAADWLCSALPLAERALVPDAGHLPNLDNPRRYDELLRQFLRRQSRAAA